MNIQMETSTEDMVNVGVELISFTEEPLELKLKVGVLPIGLTIEEVKKYAIENHIDDLIEELQNQKQWNHEMNFYHYN